MKPVTGFRKKLTMEKARYDGTMVTEGGESYVMSAPLLCVCTNLLSDAYLYNVDIYISDEL